MKSIFLGTVNPKTTESELLGKFEQLGAVERVEILPPANPTLQSGIAFVEMHKFLGADVPGFSQLHISTDDALSVRVEDTTRPVDLEALVNITARAIEVLGSREKALEWLRSPIPALRNETPLGCLSKGYGFDQVADVLGRLEHGVW